MQLEVPNTEWHEQTPSYHRPYELHMPRTHILGLAKCLDDFSVIRVERFIPLRNLRKPSPSDTYAHAEIILNHLSRLDRAFDASLKNITRICSPRLS